MTTYVNSRIPRKDKKIIETNLAAILEEIRSSDEIIYPLQSHIEDEYGLRRGSLNHYITRKTGLPLPLVRPKMFLGSIGNLQEARKLLEAIKKDHLETKLRADNSGTIRTNHSSCQRKRRTTPLD